MVYILDLFVPSLEIRLLGTIFSAIAYGIVIVLSGNCFHLLYRKQGTYSTRMQIFLLIYTAFMLLLSTWTLIQSIFQIYALIFLQENLPSLLFQPITLLLTIWGADGVMIWRCFILYQSISKAPRVAIIVLLSLLSFASFAFGITVLIQSATVAVIYQNDPVGVFTLLSTLVNIILAALIVFRLIYHRRRVQSVLGAEHGSLYSNVMTICIESSALIAVSSGILAILAFTDRDTIFMYLLLPYICVISPLLIVYRVAVGRATPSTVKPSEQVTAQLRFYIPPSSPSRQGDV